MTPYLLLLFFIFTWWSASAIVSRYGKAASEHATSNDHLSRANKTESENGHLKTWSWSDYSVVIALVSFSGLRYMVGTDWRSYEFYFNALRPYEPWGRQISASPQDPGFTVLELVIKSFSSSGQSIFWVTAALTVVPVIWRLKRDSADPALAIVLYVLLGYFLQPMNIVRQGLANSLLFAAGVFLAPKLRAGYFPAVVVGFFLHSSTLLTGLVQVVVTKIKFKWSLFVLAVVASLAVALLPWVKPFYLEIASALNGRFATYAAQGVKAGMGTYLVILAKVLLLGFALLLKPEGDQEKGYFHLAAWSIPFLVLGTQEVEMSRFDQGMSIYLTLLLPNLISRNRHKVAFTGALVLFGIAYFFVYLANYEGLVPYSLAS